MPGFLDGTRRLAFGLTEPEPRLRRHLPRDHRRGRRRRVGDQRHEALQLRAAPRHPRHHLRPHVRRPRLARRHHAPSSCPPTRPGFNVDFFWWTFNMPTDHAEVTMTDVRVGADALFGRLDHGLELAQHFVHENRIRQAASSLGAAQYCIDEAVAYANERITWGKRAVDQPGHPVPARRAAHRGGDAPPAHPPDGLADGPPAPHGGHPPGRHVQLPGQPPRLRRRRPGHADLRRHRLHAPHAVRAHLPPPPPLPHHRGLRGDPDAQGRPAPVRLRPQAVGVA